MRIAILGCGDVGSTLAYVIMQCRAQPELDVMLFNKTLDKALGCALDLTHAAVYYPGISFTAHSFDNLELCKGAQVIVIAVGVGLSDKVKDRNQLAVANTGILLPILQRLRACVNSVFLIITNPVDNMTYVATKYLSRFSIPHSRVIGLGTIVETARYISLLGEELRRNPDLLRQMAYVLGEHGATMVPIISRLDENIKSNIRNISHLIRNAAQSIRAQTGGGPKYPIALCAWHVISRLLYPRVTNTESLTVSTYIKKNRHYGINDVCISLPTILDNGGVRGIAEVPISVQEKKKLRESAEYLKNELRELKKSLEKQNRELRSSYEEQERLNNLICSII
jgi:L-lactate dehydrogenase